MVGLTRRLRDATPGLLALVGLAVVAAAIHTVVPAINRLIVAVVLGALVVNLLGVPAWARAGVDTHERLLEAGIVLMGARISFEVLADGGPTVVLLVVATVLFTLGVSEALGTRVFEVPDRASSLLASGAAICGVSAVIAVAGGIDARRDQIALAVGSVVVLDVVTLFLFPVVGSLLALPDQVFGIWAGLSMYSTGPVLAAGFTYSGTAGEWATITKLIRNALIGVAVMGYATLYARRRAGREESSRSLASIWRDFPAFVLGFVALVGVANTGIIPAAQLATLQTASEWLFVVAFVGVGMELDRDVLETTSLRPMAVAVSSLLIVSVASLAVVSMVFG